MINVPVPVAGSRIRTNVSDPETSLGNGVFSVLSLLWLRCLSTSSHVLVEANPSGSPKSFSAFVSISHTIKSTISGGV